jgi:PAS domain S-box-containing protein
MFDQSSDQHKTRDELIHEIESLRSKLAATQHSAVRDAGSRLRPPTDTGSAPVSSSVGSRHDGRSQLPTPDSRRDALALAIDRRFAVQYAVSTALVESSTRDDLDAVAAHVLEAVGHGLGWELGTLWTIDRASGLLHCGPIWQAPGVDGSVFVGACRRQTLAPGVGLPGRVWSDERPAWVENLAADDNFPRLRAALDAGLHAAFAFPVRGPSGIFGVFEFFSRALRSPDTALLHMAMSVGNQVGQVVERHRAEAAERASLARQAAIIGTALDGIVGMDTDGRINEFNPAAERMFGYQRAEVIGQDLADALIPPALRARYRGALVRYLATGEQHQMDHRMEMTAMRADASLFPVELAITRIPLNDPPAFVGYIRDITDRRRSEDELTRLLAREREAREAAESVSHRLATLQAITDTALAHLSFDDLISRLLERVRTAMEVDNVAILLPSEDGKALMLRAVLGPQEEVARTVRVPVGRGIAGRIMAERQAIVVDDLNQADLINPYLREHFHSLLGVPLLVEDRVLGVIHVATLRAHHFSEDDVTLLRLVADRIALALDLSHLYEAERAARRDAQSAEQRARALADELAAIIDAIPSGVLVCDASGQLIRVNRQGAAFLGQPSQQAALGSLERYATTSSLRYPDGTTIPTAERPLIQALRGITRTDFRGMIRHSESGRAMHIQFSFAPIRDGGGAIIGAVAVTNDITEMYRLERQKDEFLSIASHELKTPLTTLKILTQLTRRRLERLNLLETEHTARMDRAIARIERLVNDLLDASRIESGKLALRIERCDLAEVCRQAIAEQHESAERDITGHLPDAPIWVEADADRIEQVLANLLSNALKYSAPESPVTLTLETHDGEAIVSVEDQGVGIPPDAVDHLFERFYRVPGVQVQSGSGVGLGLGLFISREIVERHGGRIWADSVVGVGSVFGLDLPLAMPLKD